MLVTFAHMWGSQASSAGGGGQLPVMADPRLAPVAAVR